MNTPTFELDRPSAAFIATLEVDSSMMQAPRNGDGFGLVSAVGVRIGDYATFEGGELKIGVRIARLSD
jgi:hypothetical protein